MKFNKSVNLQLLGIIVALFAVIGFIGDGSPPDIQERSSHVKSS